MAFRMVIDYEGGSWQPDVDGTFSQDAFAYHVSISCNHCNNPVCTRVCPTGAMHKDELGLVWPDATKCIGCGYCTMACPYHAPHIDARLKRSSKCDGCRGRVEAGKDPICVEACPMRALEFGEIGELRAREGSLCDVAPLPPGDYTHPNIVIVPHRHACPSDAPQGVLSNGKEI